MPIINQVIKGRSVNRVTIEATDADLTDVLALLEGEITQYKEEGTAGTAGVVHPSTYNTMKLSLKKDKFSCSFTIRHCKPTVGMKDLISASIGKLDAGWDDVALKADKLNKFYDSSRNGA